MAEILQNQVCYTTLQFDEPWTYENYLKIGGYQALRKIIDEKLTPDDVVELVKASGLRGRGGAGFPTGLKWSFMPKESPQSYFVVNSDESEPGTCKDRDLIRFNPVIGTLGAGAYICGEETALLESLEGKKGQPRFKPPFPAGYGLYGKPTTINNTESVSSVPAIIRNGPQWFADMGIEKAGGQKCFSVSGHIAAPGNFEINLGTPFATLLELAGGMKDGIPLKAVIPGGSSVPVVPGDQMMQINMDYDSIGTVGSMLGSGAVIVMNETTCMVQALRRISRFYYSESCGQCTPCREGTGWLYRMLTRIVEGEGLPEDIDKLEDVAGKIAGRIENKRSIVADKLGAVA